MVIFILIFEVTLKSSMTNWQQLWFSSKITLILTYNYLNGIIKLP